MLIIVVPASVRIIGVSSPTIIIFLNESSILRNEASSCLNFSSKISRPINYHIYYQKLCLVTLFSNAKSGLFSEFAKFSCLYPSFSPLYIYVSAVCFSVSHIQLGGSAPQLKVTGNLFLAFIFVDLSRLGQMPTLQLSLQTPSI